MKRYLYIFIYFTCCIACSKQDSSLFAEIKDIRELSLAEVRIEKTFIIDDPDIHFKDIGSRSGIFTDAVDWVKRKASVGKRIGIYSFGTYYSAFIDLSKLTADDVIIDSQRKHCTLILPAIEIKEWGRDFDIKTEHERVSIYRSRLTPQERAQAKDEASRILSREISENTVFKDAFIKNAEDKARTYFTILLSNWDYQSEIKFKDS